MYLIKYQKELLVSSDPFYWNVIYQACCTYSCSYMGHIRHFFSEIVVQL